MDSADALRSFGIMVTTDDEMWRLMYGHAGNHYMNNQNKPERLGVFATMEKFLFRQRVLLMCSLNVEAAKGLNDMVKESSLKVGINLEMMENVLKEPMSLLIGTGGGVPDTASTGSNCPGTVGGGRRSHVEYEKAPWIEATVRSILPEPSADMHDMWFYVDHGRDEMIICPKHYNGNEDETIPTDFMTYNHGYGKACIVCRANETMRDFQLWPPEYQRKTIIKTAARTRAFFNILSENFTPATDPQKDFVRFLKDITKAMVGNKGCDHGEILMKALSHFGMVRVPRDRVKQIFTGKRGRQYGVIREEFTLDDGTETHERFAYRVTKDYGNVFYKDYLKMVLGDDFMEVMGYADAAAEKCGDVVEMWLGMLDLAKMTKSQIIFMETKADPGELLAGLEASMNIFHGTTRSTTTPNSKRGGSRITEPTNYEETLVNQILRDIRMYHGLQHACLIGEKEIGVITENYKRSKAGDTFDENMESEGQGTGDGSSTTPGPAAGGVGANATGDGKSTTPEGQEAPKSPSNPEEEFQISQDKGAIVEAIDALFALADDNNVCIKCGASGHPNYDCPVEGIDAVKVSLMNLRKRLQGEDVEEGKAPKRDDEEEQKFRQENYKATRAGEYMYLQAIPLSVIGDRAHGEKSINGVRADEVGPKTKSALNDVVDTASQRGITLTCKEMRAAIPYSENMMYRKLSIGTDIGKLKILPVNGGKFYSERYMGSGVEFALPTENNPNRIFMEPWEKTYSYYFNKALRHHVGRREVWEKAVGSRRTTFSGLRCDEAGWVDIMDFLHHPWIFEHENVRTEDDGYIDVNFRAERINTMIKTVWSEFQEKNKIRIQFLCIVLDSTFDKPDEYLKKVMGVGDDIHELIATRGEVFLAPIAVRSPGGFSARGQDFRLDYNKICHPVTTRIADDITFCYHVTEFKNVTAIIKEGLRPGGHRGGRTQVFLNPFVPWDKRYKEILGGQLTHLGQPRMVLSFSVHRLMSLGVMINASGQLVVSGNIPFSEVTAAWYQANNYDWERLVVDSGKFQLVRSCQEPKEIATANTVLRVSKALMEEISEEDDVPYYDKFVMDVAKLELLHGVLSPESELRNDIVTFISENYTPGEAGHLICPACLTEIPNILSICIRCHGSLVSWGEKEAGKDESTAPGMPERERRRSGDGRTAEGDDVEMGNEEQDEIDRLVRESKRHAEASHDDDVDMGDTKTNQEPSSSGEQRQRNVPDQRVVFGNNTKDEQEEEDDKNAREQDQQEERSEARMNLPLWTTRTIQALIIQCIDIAQNEDAIDSTACTIDCMILAYLKDRYRLYHLWTSVVPAQHYYEHVKKVGLMPELDGYIPYVGETDEGELIKPNNEQLTEAFTKYSKNGKVGGRELETHLRGAKGIRTLCKIMKYLVQIGITPQLINTKASDIPDEDEERQIEARREASEFVRKIISGAFAVRSYDYFRVEPPRRDDHVHLDPIELVCAVPERCKTFTVLVTLNKIGLNLPAQFQRVWQGKLKAVQQSASQMTTCIRSLDPAERENARQFIQALGDTKPAGEQATSSTKETEATKRQRRR